ncbi:hypothetical protein BDN71DRAFT_1435049 [Pleurotus eryngii]|uniref:Uncharacterized protein n=1 Tax=Pleurotus eryngii TaxID=5323 RepID=A0A9P6DAN8_PLEER|nr:hypothetical protein BDN71DRAFT_1435049 [Pleurotus eryngii]
MAGPELTAFVAATFWGQGEGTWARGTIGVCISKRSTQESRMTSVGLGVDLCEGTFDLLHPLSLAFIQTFDFVNPGVERDDGENCLCQQAIVETQVPAGMDLCQKKTSLLLNQSQRSDVSTSPLPIGAQDWRQAICQANGLKPGAKSKFDKSVGYKVWSQVEAVATLLGMGWQKEKGGGGVEVERQEKVDICALELSRTVEKSSKCGVKDESELEETSDKAGEDWVLMWLGQVMVLGEGLGLGRLGFETTRTGGF